MLNKYGLLKTSICPTKNPSVKSVQNPLPTMTIYAHAPEHHIQNHSETENQAEAETMTTSGTETEEKIAPTAESAESSTPLCDTLSSDAATGGTSEHTSCPATPPTATNSAKVSLPVGESLFGMVVVTPFLLHFLKRKFS